MSHIDKIYTNERLLSGTIRIYNIQLEESLTATDYEPYIKEITTNIYLNEPLRKIEDNSDYIDFKNKKVYRSISKTILDGTGTYYNGDNGLTNTFRVYKNIKYSAGINPVICDKLKPINSDTSNNDTENIQFSGTNLFIRIKRNRLNSEDIAGASEYLDSNNVTVYYLLSTPIEETVDLPTIQTLNGTTCISVKDAKNIEASAIKVEY